MLIFKKFLLNPDYEFNYLGECKLSGKSIEPNNGVYMVPINGVIQPFSKEFIGLLTHFEVNFPVIELLKIRFVKTSSRLHKMKCGHFMVIKDPIFLGELSEKYGYRVIPGFPYLAINKHGDVINLVSGRPVSVHLNAYGYKSINVYDPDKGNRHGLGLHMALARAFIDNPEPEVFLSVNHKDGNKLNNHLDNLEWVTIGDNTKHAIKLGLTGKDKRCLVRDIKTGLVTEHSSVRDAMVSIGYTASNCLSLYRKEKGLVTPRLFLGRYELKLLSEEREWYYRINSNDYRKKENGFQAKNTLTGKVVGAKTLVELSNIIGVPYMRLNRALNAPENLSVDGYLVREMPEQEMEWPSKYRPAGISNIFKKKRIVIKNIETGKEITFESGREASRYLGCSPKTIDRATEVGGDIKGYRIIDVSDCPIRQ